MSEEISQDGDVGWIADEFDVLQFDDGETSINLGSTDEFFSGLGIALEDQDEYLIDAINEHLTERGMELVEDHTQLFLHKL
jgi:hypothetical protein